MTVVFEPHLIPGAAARQVAVAGVRFALHRSGLVTGGAATGDAATGYDAPPALLLHGLPQTALMWRELFAELAGDRVVLAPDLKGLGGSEAKAPYDLATQAAELAALVLHEVDGAVDLVGHGHGGSLAVALAAARPELVRRLVVLDAPLRRADHVRAYPFFALPVLPEALFSLSARRIVRRMLSRGWRAPRPLDAAVREHYVQMYADPARVAAMLAHVRAGLRAAPGTERAPGPDRVLVVWGARDPVLPLPVGERLVADLGPRSAMVSVPGAGHFVLEEAPEAVVPTVATFLRAPSATVR